MKIKYLDALKYFGNSLPEGSLHLDMAETQMFNVEAGEDFPPHAFGIMRPDLKAYPVDPRKTAGEPYVFFCLNGCLKGSLSAFWDGHNVYYAFD